MEAVELYRQVIREAHEALRDDIAGVGPELLTWRPGPDANHIAFLFWHLVRTEDNMVHRWLQESSSIWEAERWHEQFDLEPQAGGTGFTTEQVERIAYQPDKIMPYAEKVWANTEEVLQSLTDADLDREVTMRRPDGTTTPSTIGLVLRIPLVIHPWWHIGEIRYIKGLQGWRFRA